MEWMTWTESKFKVCFSQKGIFALFAPSPLCLSFLTSQSKYEHGYVVRRLPRSAPLSRPSVCPCLPTCLALCFELDTTRDKREEEMTLVARSLPCQIRNTTASLPRPHRKVMNCQNETSVLLGLLLLSACLLLLIKETQGDWGSVLATNELPLPSTVGPPCYDER